MNQNMDTDRATKRNQRLSGVSQQNSKAIGLRKKCAYMWFYMASATKC